MKRAAYKKDYPAQGFDSRFRRSLWSGIVLINATLLLVGIWVLRDRTMAAEEQANRQAENYARILDGSIAGTFQKIDLALATVVDEVESEAREGTNRDDRLLDLLSMLGKHVPETLGLRVSDADGRIRHVAASPSAPPPRVPVDISDRPHFLNLKLAGPNAGLFVSEPVLGKISNQLIIALARRHNKPDGSFGGIVYAAIPVSYFVDRLSQLDLGPRGNSGLWTRTTLIARYAKADPNGARSGATTPSQRLGELLASGVGEAKYRAVSGIDGIERNYQFRKLGDYPIHLVIGLARDDYMEEMRRELLTPMSIVLAMMIGTVLLAWQLNRSWDRQARTQRRMSQLNGALRQQHQETEAAKQRSELILGAAGDGICGIDLEGRITFINPAARSMFGWESDEGVGLSLHEATHHHRPDGSAYPLDECPIRATLSDGIPRTVDDDVYWRKDGSSFPVEYTVSSLRVKGKAIGAVNVFRDISERLRTERELKEHRNNLAALVAARTAALQETEAKASMILNSSADGLYGIDPEGIIRFANPAACAILGYADPEQMIGRPAHALLHHSHRDGSHYSPDDCPSYRSLRTGAEVRVTDEVYWRADGKAIPVIYATHPMTKDGEIVGAVTSFIDASQQQATNEARERALRAAEQLARTRSEFIANMSHEIRTPLNGVMGFAAIGMRHVDNPVKAADAFAKINASGKRLLGVINDILDFSKIEAGKMQVHSSRFDIPTIVRQSVELLEDRIHAKGLSLTVTLAADLPAACLGDEMRIRQVLLNVLTNAVKFTESGSITLSVGQENGQLVFTTLDTGIGMSREQLANLFTPFYQADSSSSRKYGGTGLGLVISQRLLELMGGDISIDSTLGQGTRATFRIPLMQPDDLTSESPRQPEGAMAADTQALAGLSILAVDDESINRLVLEEILSVAGARVTLAEGGQEAVDCVRQAGPRGFDLILMDLQMPGLGGYAATEIIRQLAPDIPVIAQTAHAFAVERERCLAAGMKAHLAKPFDPEELIDIVRQFAARPASANDA